MKSKKDNTNIMNLLKKNKNYQNFKGKLFKICVKLIEQGNMFMQAVVSVKFSYYKVQ